MATTTDLIQQLYVAYFNRPADVAGLAFWVNAYDNGGASIDTISKNFNSAAEYTAAYAGKSADAIVNTVYQNLFGRTADSAGLDFWGPKIASGAISTADLVKAISAGAVNADGTPNADGAVFNNKVAAAGAFTTELATPGNEAERVAYSTGAANVLAAAKNYIAGVTTDASLATAQANVHATAQAIVAINTPSTTTALTTGVDTVVGNAGNDVFNGSDTTVTGLDSIDGAGGNDTLNISDVAGAAANLNLLTVSNVETLNLTSTKGLANGSINISGYTGLTTAKLALQDVGLANQSLTAAATTDVTVNATLSTAATKTIGITGGKTVTFTESGIGAATAGTVTITGVAGTTSVKATESGVSTGAAGAVNVVDVNSASLTKAGSISSVSLDGIGAASTITGNALTSLTSANNAVVVTVTDNLTAHTTSTTTLGLTVNALGAGAGLTDTNATIGTLNVTSTGDDSALNVTSNTSLKTVTVAAGKAVDFTGSTWGALTSLTATGAGAITAAVGTGVTVTTADGADVITVGATTKAVKLGGGNDTAVVTVSALGAGGSIDGGTGTADVISMSTDNAATATVGTTFAASITGFEVLKLNAAATGAATIDLSHLNNISSVVVGANVGQNLTLTSFGANGTVEFDAGQTAAKTTTLSGAFTGTADVVTVKIANTAALDVKTVDASGVETVNLNTVDTATTATGIQHTLALTDTAATTIKVTGSAGVALSTVGATSVTSFDASGVTSGAVSWTSAALTAASTVKGGAGADTLVLSAATVATNVSGGAGNDTITVSNAKNNTIDGGAGNDTILVGNGNNTITGGAGNDTITVGTGANTINTGDGNDTVHIGAAAGLNTVTFGTGNATLILDGVQTAAGYYTSVTGLNALDIINVASVIDGATAVSTQTAMGSKITLGGASSFANYLDAATSATTAHTETIIKWFQFAGNTYVVQDTSNNTTFSDGHDSVIELVGLVDLSHSTIASGVITIV